MCRPCFAPSTPSPEASFHLLSVSRRNQNIELYVCVCRHSTMSRAFSNVCSVERHWELLRCGHSKCKMRRSNAPGLLPVAVTVNQATRMCAGCGARHLRAAPHCERCDVCLTCAMMHVCPDANPGYIRKLPARTARVFARHPRLGAPPRRDGRQFSIALRGLLQTYLPSDKS